MRVVDIDKRLVSSASKVVVQFAFSHLYAFETAETKEMCLTHIGYESEIRQCDIHQFLYVTRMACPHLHYSKLGIGTDAQQGERHTDIVVEIAFCGEDIVFYRQDFTY